MATRVLFYLKAFKITSVHSFQGDPAALHKEIKEENLNMAKLNEYDVEILKEFASHCQIPVSAKSRVSA